MMFRYEMKCPHCGESFTYSLLKFQSRHVCDKCHNTVIVEMRTVTMLLQAVLFVVLGQLYVQMLPSMGIENSFITYVLLFILLFILLVLIDWVFVKLLGMNSVFRVDVMIKASNKNTSKH